MSIKQKRSPEPPEDAPPPDFYSCWGCDQLYPETSFLAGHEGLCGRCFAIVRKKPANPDPEPPCKSPFPPSRKKT
jgi:hypothetical protein